ESGAAVEAGRRAGAEDAAGLQEGSRRQRAGSVSDGQPVGQPVAYASGSLGETDAVSAFARDAADVVAVAGGVDDLAIRPRQDQRVDGADRRILEPGQGGVGPAGLHLG